MAAIPAAVTAFLPALLVLIVATGMTYRMR
jgi:hypothetical protein